MGRGCNTDGRMNLVVGARMVVVLMVVVVVGVEVVMVVVAEWRVGGRGHVRGRSRGCNAKRRGRGGGGHHGRLLHYRRQLVGRGAAQGAAALQVARVRALLLAVFGAPVLEPHL